MRRGEDYFALRARATASGGANLDESSFTSTTYKRRAHEKSYARLLAQRRGFEPPYVFLRNTISSRAHSTTLPPLQDLSEIVIQSVTKYHSATSAKNGLK